MNIIEVSNPTLNENGTEPESSQIVEQYKGLTSSKAERVLARIENLKARQDLKLTEMELHQLEIALETAEVVAETQSIIEDTLVTECKITANRNLLSKLKLYQRRI